MTTPTLLLHVGYHKTATTWMQRQLFVPAHGFRQIAFHREIFDYVVAPHGFDFDPASLAALLQERCSALAPGELPVLSSEILSGHPFQGGHESDVYAERLARIAPGSRILISIRNQMRILPSVYMQYLLRGGTLPWARFFAGTDEIGYFAFTLRHFEYDRLVAYYQRLFGADRVHVLTQESLQADMDAAAASLAAFAGASRFQGLQPMARRVEAASYPEYAAPILRRINHVHASTLDPWPILSLGRTPRGLFRVVGYLARRPPLSSLMKGYRPVTAYVAEHFAGYYRDSNVRLAKLTAQSLDLTGYP